MRRKIPLLILFFVFILSSMIVIAAEDGGTLRVGTNKIQPSLDPHHDMGFGGFEKYLAINSLIKYDQNLKFQPELAVSWEIPDNKTYIFKLRKGVKFHDGTVFDASAVKWNFDRMLSDYSQVKSFFAVIESVKVVDDYTVEIKLKKPYAPFLDSIAGNGFMVSPAAVEKMGNEDFQKHPVGTGPFVFESLDTQKGELIFTKNENYWQQKGPYLDRIVLTEIPEAQTRLFALQTGKVDYVYPVPATNVPDLKKSDEIKLISVLAKSNTIDFLTFNCKQEPFTDKRVRNAIRYALDKDKIVNFLAQTEKINGPLPESSWGSNPDKKIKEYNLDKAKGLMKEAGYSDGFDVTLKIWSNDSRRSDLALIVKEMLTKINVDVKVEVLETGTLFQQMMQGKFEFASLHWGGGGSLDPNGNLHVLFSSNNQYNWIANYQNEQVDKYLQQALETTDRKERQQLYWKAEEIIIGEQPMIWFGRFIDYIGYSSRVRGVDPLRPAGYIPIFENLWIEQ